MNDALLVGNIFIMITDLRLGGRSVDRLRKFIGFLQAFRKLDAADGSVFFIACPSAACDIASYDTLDRKHRELFAHHAVSVEARLAEKLRHVIDVCGDHMVRNDIFCHFKPEF